MFDQKSDQGLPKKSSFHFPKGELNLQFTGTFGRPDQGKILKVNEYLNDNK